MMGNRPQKCTVGAFRKIITKSEIWHLNRFPWLRLATSSHQTRERKHKHHTKCLCRFCQEIHSTRRSVWFRSTEACHEIGILPSDNIITETFVIQSHLNWSLVQNRKRLCTIQSLQKLCFTFQLGKTKYHLSHHFDVKNDVHLMVGDERPGVGGVPLPGQKAKPQNSYIPPGMGSNQPAWVAFDKQVVYRSTLWSLDPDLDRRAWSIANFVSWPWSRLDLVYSDEFFLCDDAYIFCRSFALTLTSKKLCTKKEKNSIVCVTAEFTSIWRMIQYKWMNHGSRMPAFHKVCCWIGVTEINQEKTKRPYFEGDNNLGENMFQGLLCVGIELQSHHLMTTNSTQWKTSTLGMK